MSYIVISIGNTDNKLTQQEWHDFVHYVNDTLDTYSKIHFFGGASNWERWQNVAWICEISESIDYILLSDKLKDIKKFYKQDSIFVQMGDGIFI